MIAYDRVTQALQRVTGYEPRREGDNWICPAHEDQSPSLHVTQVSDKVLLTCHANCSMKDVVHKLGLKESDLFDEPLEPKKPEIIATYPYVSEVGEILYEVVRYLPKDFRQRKPDGKGDYTWNLKDVRRVPFHLPQLIDGVRNKHRVLVVEGEADVLALERAGEVATTSAGGAGSWRSEFAKFFEGATVIIMADRDVPGVEHARTVEASLASVAASVRVVQAKDGKDAADHLAAGHTVNELVPLVFSVGTLTHQEPPLRETYLRVEEFSENGGPVTGLPTGFKRLDQELTGMYPGNFIVIGARPSVGKSAIALGIAAHVAYEVEKPVLMVSLEMSAMELCQRLLAKQAQVGATKIRTGKGLDGRDWQKLHEALEKISPKPLYLDDNSSSTIPQIHEKVERLNDFLATKNQELSLIIVDYLQLMSGRRRDNRQVEVSEFSRNLKVMAGEFKIPVIALSQLSRNLEYREEKVPVLADLRESGAIENDADVVLLLHRDDTGDSADVIIAKHRNGPIGTVKLAFHERFAAFQDL